MKFKLKKLFSSSNLKRFLSVFLCAVILVFGMHLIQPLEAEAVTGVDDVVLLGIVALSALGVTFSTVSAAQNMSMSWLDKMSSDDKNIFIEAVAVQHPIATGLVQLTANEWYRLYQSFCASFPQYANLGHQTLNISADIHQQIMSAGLYSYLVAGNVLDLGELPVGVDVDVTFQTSSSSIFRYCGKEIIDNNYSYLLNDVYLQNSIDHNAQYLLSSVPALDIVSFSRFSEYSDSVVYPGYNIYNYTFSNKYGTQSRLQYDMSSGSISSLDLSSNTFFKGERVEFSQNEYGRWSLVTSTYGNLIAYWVSTGAIPQSSPLINCDDWTYKGEIDGLLLGKDVFDVGLDIEHAPAIDGFPSQVGDVSDVDSYPDTIPLNIPTTLTDETIDDLTADIVRDVSSSDTDTDTSTTPPKVDPPTDETKNLKDTLVTSLENGMPFTDALSDFFRGFEKQAKPLKFEFEFRGQKYYITTDFYTPYRERIRSVLSVFFAVISLLAIWRMWRSLFGQGIGSISGSVYTDLNSSGKNNSVRKGG